MLRVTLSALMVLGAVASAAAQTHVDGYYRDNGTYVQPHYRSSPNNSTYDNYSTKGNTNPYTGERGTQNPDRYSRPSNCGLYC